MSINAIGTKPIPVFQDKLFQAQTKTDIANLQESPNWSFTLSDTPETDKRLSQSSVRFAAEIRRLQDKSSYAYSCLKTALQTKGLKGFNALHFNLILINVELRAKNEKSIFIRAVICIINAVRSLFGYAKLSFDKYEIMDLDVFRNASEQILETLIDERQNFAQHSLNIGKVAPKELSSRNLKALELGFKDSIAFKHGSNHFALRFDTVKNIFNLNFYRSDSQLPFEQSLTSKQRFEAKIIDTATGNEYAIPYEITFYKQGITNAIECSYKNSKGLDLEPNREYQILSPNGLPLSFKITKRSK